MVVCPLCGRELDGSRAVIWEWHQGDEVRQAYAPFMEDLRTSPERLSHPECYAERFGLRAVLELVAEHDQKERRGFWKMWYEIESLKKRLAASERE